MLNYQPGLEVNNKRSEWGKYLFFIKNINDIVIRKDKKGVEGRRDLSLA